jgi:hypothetical protein
MSENLPRASWGSHTESFSGLALIQRRLTQVFYRVLGAIYFASVHCGVFAIDFATEFV